MHRDLLEVAFLAEFGQGLGGAAVKAGAAQDVALVEHRLADERVSELEPLRGRGGPQQPGAEDLVERRLGGIRLEPGGGLQGACVVLQAEDRGGGDQLVRVIAHSRQADADRVPDALRHDVRAGLGQLSQHLLDEERVAVGAGVHAWRDLVAAEHRAGEPLPRRPAAVRAGRCGQARRCASARPAQR